MEFHARYLIPILLIGGWFAMLWLLARLSGWTRLAQTFRQDRPIPGQKFHFVSGNLGLGKYHSLWQRLGSVGFRSILFVTIGDQGFRLSVFAPFSAFTPPLYVPWHSVAALQQSTGLFGHFTIISLTHIPAWIGLYGAAGREIVSCFSARPSAPSGVGR